MRNRVWEIDFFRGVAIILMIVFHIIVDLKDYYSYNIDYFHGFWFIVGKVSAILFIFISGISFTFSRNNMSRGFKVIALGMLLTFITYLINPQFYIKFGILHFLGISIIISILLKRSKEWVLLLLGIIVLLLGFVFNRFLVPTNLLFPLGLFNDNFSSLDYYPIFPWYGVFLMGIALGKKFYIEKLSIFKKDFKEGLISLIGRHSLEIYLIHQPVIIGILFILNRFWKFV